MFVWNKLFCCLSLSDVLCLRNYRYNTLVVLALVELNSTIAESIERIILTHGNIVACIVLRATLANDDVTCNNLLTAENLNTKSLSC